MKIHSLTQQLRLWLLIPMLIVLTLSAMVSYARALRFANLAYDRALYRSVLAISDQVMVDDDAHRLLINLPEVASNLLKFNDGDQMFLRINAPNGRLVMGEKQLHLPSLLPKANDHVYFSGSIQGEKIRGVVYALPVSEKAADGNILISMAETTSKRDAMVTEIVEEMLLPQILIMLLASVVIEISIRLGLKPIHTLSDEIHQRSHRDLSPIQPKSALFELQPLLDAMNSLLGRVRSSIQQQQEFIADASHQLRTPIAGLQAQIELAMRNASNPVQHERLGMLVQSIQRMSHLIQRLLSLARTESTINDDSPHRQVSLKAVIVDTCERLISRAIEKNIELEVQLKASHDTVTGDALLLGELLANLLDNAIHYTPASGLIVLSLIDNDHGLTLQVSDSGVGIPLEERENVFKRFHRLQPNQGNGCGLGLAIVAEIAAWHGARIEITEGLPHPHSGQIGVCLRVIFPASAVTHPPTTGAEPS